MDVMDGLECTRRMRAGTDCIDPKLAIILQTGSDSERAAYDAGADLFMEKPFSIKKLDAGIVKIIGAA